MIPILLTSSVMIMIGALSRSQVPQPQRGELIQASLNELDNMRNGISTLLNGGSLYGRSVSTDLAVHDIGFTVTEQACHILSTHAYDKGDPAEMYAACMAYDNGIFTKSFFSAVMRYTDTAYYAINAIPLNNDTGSAVFDNSDFWMWYGKLHDLEGPFYREICNSLSHEQLKLISDTASTASQAYIAIASSCTCAYIVFLFTVYIHMIRAVGKHLADTQRMLLIFDDESLTNAGGLKTLIADVMAGWRGQAMESKPVTDAAAGLKMLWKCGCRGAGGLLKCCGSGNRAGKHAAFAATPTRQKSA